MEGHAIRRTLLGMAFGLVLNIGVSQADEGNFQWSRSVELPELTEATLIAVRLDADVYAATQDGLPDLRLRNARGESVAFVVRPATTTKERTVRSSWTAEQVSAKPLESGGLEVVLRLRDKESAPNGVRIVTPLRDFEHRVRVFTSADGAGWQTAGEPALIFDYSRFVDARSDSVGFAASSHRHFRIVIDDATSEQESQLMELRRELQSGSEVQRSERTAVARRPFRIERVEFFRDETKTIPDEPLLEPYPARDVRIAEDADEKQTVVSFTMQREPVSELSLDTDDANFSRSVTVQLQNPETAASKWRTLAQGTVTRLAFQSLTREDVTLAVPETRGTQFRLLVANGDSAPLQLKGVSPRGPVHELLFLAQPGDELTLFYGDPRAEQPSYDTAAVHASLSAGYNATLATLGPAVKHVVSARFRWSTLVEDVRIVIAVIAALTALLGWALYSASRRIQPLAKGD